MKKYSAKTKFISSLPVGQVKGGHPVSSEKSRQSLSASHLNCALIQRPFLHANCPVLHVGRSQPISSLLSWQSSSKSQRHLFEIHLPLLHWNELLGQVCLARKVKN